MKPLLAMVLLFHMLLVHHAQEQQARLEKVRAVELELVMHTSLAQELTHVNLLTLAMLTSLVKIKDRAIELTLVVLIRLVMKKIRAVVMLKLVVFTSLVTMSSRVMVLN